MAISHIGYITNNAPIPNKVIHYQNYHSWSGKVPSLQSLQAYARSLADHPELADLVAGEANGEQGVEVDGAAAEGRGAKRKRIYEDHRPMSSITAGIKAGTLHQVRGCCAPQADCCIAVCTLRSPCLLFFTSLCPR